MAIYHLHCKIISRSKGHSSVKSSAYRSCEKITDERTGEIHNYTSKKGLQYSEILTPDNTPEKYKNRSDLWNEVEKIEKRKDSQLAKEIEIGLPKELSKDEQINLTKEFVKDNFIKSGMIADINIHDIKKGNPHAHIMLTTRFINENSFGQKNRDWNNKELLNSWRESWEHKANKYLEKNKRFERIDHRSYKAQGIEKIPNNLSMAVYQMEARGIKTEKGNASKEIKEINNKIIDINYLKQKYAREKEVVAHQKSNEDIRPKKLAENTYNLKKEIQNINNLIFEAKEKINLSMSEKYKIEKDIRFLESIEEKYKDNKIEFEKLKDERLEIPAIRFIKHKEIDKQMDKIKESSKKIKEQIKNRFKNDYEEFNFTEIKNNLEKNLKLNLENTENLKQKQEYFEKQLKETSINFQENKLYVFIENSDFMNKYMLEFEQLENKELEKLSKKDLLKLNSEKILNSKDNKFEQKVIENFRDTLNAEQLKILNEKLQEKGIYIPEKILYAKNKEIEPKVKTKKINYDMDR